MMRVAIVGCGFVADYYVRSLSAHPGLELVGVTDRDAERAERFARYYSLSRYESLDELLVDPRVEIILNLTNPSSHYEVSKQALLAGKHVYSEKPMAMHFDEATELVELAEGRRLQISSAPCSLLGETAQTMWKALREERVGPVRLVYAELDDGLVHKMPYKVWRSESGTPWPYEDEFEVGCTLEHAGYYLTWLAAFFGPVEWITAFSSCLVPDKILKPSPTGRGQGEGGLPNAGSPSPQPSPAGRGSTPDFSVACLKFSSGMVARLTCSIVAPHDHAITIVGDGGIITTKDCWYYRSKVYVRRLLTIRRKALLSPFKKKYPMAKSGFRSSFRHKGSQQMDFARGVAELAEAIEQGRKPRLSARFSLHVLEATLAIQNALDNSATYRMTTTFDPIEPMPWAK
jgi:predicted dehydrogenase